MEQHGQDLNGGR